MGFNSRFKGLSQALRYFTTNRPVYVYTWHLIFRLFFSSETQTLIISFFFLYVKRNFLIQGVSFFTIGLPVVEHKMSSFQSDKTTLSALQCSVRAIKSTLCIICAFYKVSKLQVQNHYIIGSRSEVPTALRTIS